MSKRSRTVQALLLSLLAAGTLAAQQPERIRAELPSAADSAPTLTPEARRQVVDSLTTVLERYYVTPDTARTLAEHLRHRARGGAYDGIATPAELARALTEEIQSIHPDRHLNVRVAGQGPPPGMRRRGRDEGSGIERVERLEGNVGYLKLSLIGEAFDEMAAALRSLDGTDAVILDLRGVPGGSARMADFLVSHFVRPNVHSLSVYTPARGDTTHRYTLAEVPGPRRLDVPLYVLVDRGSASAAEHIPFVLQNLGRATIVGERTAGAGRNNRMYPIGSGLAASVSVTRVWEPRTGREWERVGVQPELEVPPARALEAARQHALTRTAERRSRSR